jgi:hypothetical protein
MSLTRAARQSICEAGLLGKEACGSKKKAEKVFHRRFVVVPVNELPQT